MKCVVTGLITLCSFHIKSSLFFIYHGNLSGNLQLGAGPSTLLAALISRLN